MAIPDPDPSSPLIREQFPSPAAVAATTPENPSRSERAQNARCNKLAIFAWLGPNPPWALKENFVFFLLAEVGQRLHEKVIVLNGTTVQMKINIMNTSNVMK